MQSTFMSQVFDYIELDLRPLWTYFGLSFCLIGPILALQSLLRGSQGHFSIIFRGQEATLGQFLATLALLLPFGSILCLFENCRGSRGLSGPFFTDQEDISDHSGPM